MGLLQDLFGNVQAVMQGAIPEPAQVMQQALDTSNLGNSNRYAQDYISTPIDSTTKTV